MTGAMPGLSNVRPRGFSTRGSLLVVCLATAMLMLDIAVVNTALARIANDLHSGLTGVQWIVDAYTVALATVVLTTGSLADRLGRRRIFVWGMALFTVTSLVCARASSIALLDGARGIQGIGAAMMFASSLAILTDAFPAGADRSKAFAAYGATIGASFAIGPLVGGALTSGIGWRAVFYINVPLGLATIAAALAWVRESSDPLARRLDWAGQATLSGGTFLLVLALLRGNQEGWTSPEVLLALGGAGLLLSMFVEVQRRGSAPMLPLGLFRRRDFSAAQLAAFAISASFYAIFLYTTLYLQEVLHLSPIEAGLVYLPGTILVFAASAASAQITRQIPSAALVILGLALVAGGLILMTTAGARSSWTAFLPGELVVCLGTGLFNPALAAVAMGSVSERRAGLAAGVNDAFRQVGIAVGVAVFGALVPGSAALGHGSAPAYVSGLHHCLLVGATLATAGAGGAALLLKQGARERRRSQAATANSRRQLIMPLRTMESRNEQHDHLTQEV